MAESQERIALLMLVAPEAMAIWAAVNPSYFTAATFSHDAADVTLLRRGEAMGTVLILAFGLLVSFIMTSKLPLAIAAVAALVMVGLTEHALRTSTARPMTAGAA